MWVYFLFHVPAAPSGTTTLLQLAWHPYCANQFHRLLVFSFTVKLLHRPTSISK